MPALANGALARITALIDGVDPAVIVENLPSPILLLDGGRVIYANPAAEQLLSIGRPVLFGKTLADLLAPHSTLLALASQVTAETGSISEYGIELALKRGMTCIVDAHLTPVPEAEDQLLLALQPCSLAERFDRRLANQHTGRSIAGLAQTLAHEVKNPLSGIRGAAQLLLPALNEEDQTLVQLICDETDRICALVDRMDAFSAPGRIERKPVNIHRVLEHVRRLAQNGFARHLRIIERYDPSIPDVDCDRDQLIQVFLNLIKNAAEAAPEEGGQITLRTQYQHGFRMSVGAAGDRLELPITVEVQDNGPGVPPDMVDHLFQPFVSTKPKGSGLGLSLVAKIIGEHGGLVAYGDGQPGAVFKVRLPAARQ
jgi:two-component system, NtrC family, nitrogen regulation sensor histidine kinase GlnL